MALQKSVALLATVSAVAIVSAQTQAATVALSFTGTITDTGGQYDVHNVSEGDTIQGQIQFEQSSLTPILEREGETQYRIEGGATTSISASMGGTTYDVSLGDGEWAQVEIDNEDFFAGTYTDKLQFRTSAIGCCDPVFGRTYVDLQFSTVATSPSTLTTSTDLTGETFHLDPSQATDLFGTVTTFESDGAYEITRFTIDPSSVEWSIGQETDDEPANAAVILDFGGRQIIDQSELQSLVESGEYSRDQHILLDKDQLIGELEEIFQRSDVEIDVVEVGDDISAYSSTVTARFELDPERGFAGYATDITPSISTDGLQSSKASILRSIS